MQNRQTGRWDLEVLLYDEQGITNGFISCPTIEAAEAVLRHFRTNVTALSEEQLISLFEETKPKRLEN